MRNKGAIGHETTGIVGRSRGVTGNGAGFGAGVAPGCYRSVFGAYLFSADWRRFADFGEPLFAQRLYPRLPTTPSASEFGAGKQFVVG